MAQFSNIEWTDATWNPTVGCSLVSPGCTNCYAMRMAARCAAAGVAHYAGTTAQTKAGPVWTGVVREAPAHIMNAPWRWKKPRRIFVNSMSDLFHPAVSDEVRHHVFTAAAENERHTLQVLTKRAKIMKRWVERNYSDPPDNLWLGVSVEDRDRRNRISDLFCTPAAVRFLSCEPLLGNLGELDLSGIHWCIAGGESGPGKRPVDPDWIRSIRDQCAEQGVPLFVKQIDKVQPIPDDLMIRQFPSERGGG